jgi:hypothetical protein
VRAQGFDPIFLLGLARPSGDAEAIFGATYWLMKPGEYHLSRGNSDRQTGFSSLSSSREVSPGSGGLGVRSRRLQYDPERPARYEITVRGWVDESWSDWLDGVTVAQEVGSDDAPITRLTATIVDQAALHSLLRRLHRLHLPLLSLNLVE